MNLRLFAVTAPGLEPFAMRELAGLGIAAQAEAVDEGEEGGGVAFEGGLDALYRANLHLRTASRVLVRLGDFYAAGFPELRKKAARLPWESYLAPGGRLAVRVTCHKSKLYHSGAVAERIAAAAGDRLGKPPEAARFDESAPPLPQLVVVRLLHDHCTISVDSSGALLHRRGYRLETAKAPLRETLAAAMLFASGWAENPSAPLLDPFCGSGTIAIEAALMARRAAPGKQRRFAFMDWPGYDDARWQALLAQAAANERPAPGVIQASDRDAGAVRTAQANAERAGVAGEIQFDCRAVSGIQPPPGPGWVVTNPPYGVRISPGRDLRDLYAQFGNVLRAHCPGWELAMLCSTPYLAGHTRIRFERALPLLNGGMPVKLFVGRVGAQSD